MKQDKAYSPRVRLINSRASLLLGQSFILSLFVFVLLFGLAYSKHFLLNTHVFDLGLYEQWAYLAGEGRWSEQGSLFEGISRGGRLLFGDHLSMVLFPIGLLYKIYPSTVVLLVIQSFFAAVSFFVVIKMPWDRRLEPMYEYVLAFLFLLSPIFFNSSLDLFSLEVIAFPMLYASISSFKSSKFFLGLLLLLAALACKDSIGIWASGIGVYLALKKRYLAGISSFAISSGWFLFALRVNEGNHDKLAERLPSLGSQSLDVLQFLHLSLGSIEYILVVLFPLVFVFRKASLFAVLGMLPVVAVNILSTADTMRSLIYHYQLPIFFWIVVAYRDSGCELGLPFLRLRKSVVKLLFASMMFVYFLLFAQYDQPFTVWWSKAGHAFEFSRIRPAVIESARLLSNSSDNSGCKFFTDGSIAPHFAGVDDVCWLPEQLQVSESDIYVFLPKSPPLARPNQSWPRLIVNRIFGYGHQAEPSFDARIDEFISGKKGSFSCRDFGGRRNSWFVECSGNSR